jgi:predicted TIM-barrel fold metal-dependent hydrolase
MTVKTNTQPLVDARVRLPMDRRPEAARTKPAELTQRYDEILGTAATRHRSTAELLGDMDEAGVAWAVLHAEYESGDYADALNEAVADLVREYPQKFIGFGTVSLAPLQPMRAIRQAEELASLGLIGINIQPAFFDVPIDDARLYPLYARASDLGLVVAIHTGVNYSTAHPMDLEQPTLLDRIACNFPDLRLIACHAGWPWVDILCAVMRRHPHVYADFGGLAPKYVDEDGTGWATLRRLLDGPLRNQILFASDWPVFPMLRSRREWEFMGLKQETLEKLLAGNARSLFERSI